MLCRKMGHHSYISCLSADPNTCIIRTNVPLWLKNDASHVNTILLTDQVTQAACRASNPDQPTGVSAETVIKLKTQSDANPRQCLRNDWIWIKERKFKCFRWVLKCRASHKWLLCHLSSTNNLRHVQSKISPLRKCRTSWLVLKKNKKTNTFLFQATAYGI